MNRTPFFVICLVGYCASATAQITVQQFTRSVNTGVRGVTNCIPTVVSVFESQSSPALPVVATNHTASISLASDESHQATCNGVLASDAIRADRLQATGTITSAAQGTNFFCFGAVGPLGGGQVAYRAEFTCATPIRYQLTAGLTREITGSPTSGTSVGGRVRLYHNNSTNSYFADVSAGVSGTNFTQTGVLFPGSGTYVLEVEADSSASATNPPAATAASFTFEILFDECVLTCPSTQYAVEDGDSGAAVVTFADPVGPEGCEFETVVCDPPSGSSFPVGVTTVNCVATDAFANETTCSFDVVVWDRTADDDGDGVTNGDELAAGTDPFDANSVLRFIAITRQSDDIRVTWETGIGRTNALQRSASVAGGYSDIFTVTNTTGSVTNYVDPSAGTNSPSLFYRVRVVPGTP